jgi:hypothetical protein
MFSLFLVLLFAGPWLLSGLGIVDESKNYPTALWSMGEFAWIQQQTFEQSGDVDIAFLGSSHMWTAIDTGYVQQKLSERLHRKAVVLTLGWNWAGYDALYTVTANLLEQRRVRMVVVYDENLRRIDAPHPLAYRLVQPGAHKGEFDGMLWQEKFRIYAGSILGLPRHILSLIRPDRIEDSRDWGRAAYLISIGAENLADRLGSLRAHKQMDAIVEDASAHKGGPPTADEVNVFPGGRDGVKYTGPVMGPYQGFFARKFAELCVRHGTRIVGMHLPLSGQQAESVVTECQPWQDVFGVPVDLVGIPGAELFAGIPASDLHRYFYEKDHFNRSGQDLFTPLVTPALLAIYASSPGRP